MALSKQMYTPLMLVAGLMLMKKLDLTDPTTIFYIRIAFAVGVAITLLQLAMIYLSIQRVNDQRQITLQKSQLQPASPFDAFKNAAAQAQGDAGAAAPNAAQGETETMTVCQYDFLKWRQQAQQTLTTLAIVSGIHWYMGVVQPLLLQSYMLPLQLSQSELTKIHVLQQSDTAEGNTRPFGGTAAARIEPAVASSSANGVSASATSSSSASTSATDELRNADTSTTSGARKRR